jgi:hypothetical protein
LQGVFSEGVVSISELAEFDLAAYNLEVQQ